MKFSLEKFSHHYKETLSRAVHLAIELNKPEVSPDLLLISLLEQSGSAVSKILGKHKLNFEKIKNTLTNKEQKIEITPVLNEETMKIIDISSWYAQDLRQPHVGTEHLLMALLDSLNPLVISIFKKSGLNINEIENELRKFIAPVSQDISPNQEIYKEVEAVGQKPIKKPSPLELFAKNLTEKKNTLEKIHGRVFELNRVCEILLRKNKNNPLLIGEPGVGKTALVEGLAKMIVDKKAPTALADKKIYQLDISSLVAGTMYRGEFESRIKELINEVSSRPEVILFVDELHTMIGAGSTQGTLDVANILKPALARGDLKLIGATTTEEYKKYLKNDAALERRFQSIYINEPTSEEALEMLVSTKKSYEKHHGVKIQLAALRAAVDLSVQFLPNRKLPDKALDLIDESCASCKVSQKNIVTNKEVAEVVSRTQQLPLDFVMSNEISRLEKLAEEINKEILGQKRAVEKICTRIKRSRTLFKNQSRPIASFIFAGASGVGKTYTAKVLAEKLFYSKSRLLKLDMSEYGEKHSIAKLLGSPAGYVGYKEESILSKAMRAKNSSVILFDEIEKAHPDVFNLLLQILDDGKITDSSGEILDFKNTVIILTTNLGNDFNTIGFSKSSEIQFERVNDSLKQFLRKELLNRIDEVVLFETLSPSTLEDLAVFKGNLLSMSAWNRPLNKTSHKSIKKLVTGKNDARSVEREVEKYLEKIAHGQFKR